MKTILVAIDFSDGSLNALFYAKKLAKILDNDLIMVHAYTPPILDPNVPGGLAEETYTQSLSILEDKLQKEVEIARKDKIRAEYKLGFGDLASIIDDLSVHTHLNMIIVGKTSHSGLIDTIIGSTAAYLIDSIEVPLLVVPEDFRADLFDKFCYASQLEYDEEKYIAEAIKFSKYSNNSLEIAHIKDSDELDIYPDQEFLKSIAERFKDDNLHVIHKESKSFKKGIQQLVQEEGISLLILTTHKRGFLDGILNPSKTKQILKHTAVPILIYSFE